MLQSKSYKDKFKPKITMKKFSHYITSESDVTKNNVINDLLIKMILYNYINKFY